jgi:hypothetical protein
MTATSARRPQSLRGHLRECLTASTPLPTDFPRHCPLHTERAQLGFHRYKPTLQTTFLPSHPKLRCQSLPSLWTLGQDKPVIPGVPFSRLAPALPLVTDGSLVPTFVPARPVGLAVKLPCALALDARWPTGLREPWGASVTFWEATAPVKLPARRGPGPGLRASVRNPAHAGRYLKGGSTPADADASKPPAYPSQHAPKSNT